MMIMHRYGVLDSSCATCGKVNLDIITLAALAGELSYNINAKRTGSTAVMPPSVQVSASIRKCTGKGYADGICAKRH